MIGCSIKEVKESSDILYLPKGASMKTIGKIIISAAVITVIVVISGCSGMSTRDRNTALGAGVGAVGGAVLTGGSTLGTVGGAAVGGVIGNQIGDSKLKK